MNIEVLVSDFSPSEKKPGDCIIKGHGKWIIVPDSRNILKSPPHFKVALEITRELDKVRIARVKEVIKTPSLEEKRVEEEEIAKKRVTEEKEESERQQLALTARYAREIEALPAKLAGEGIVARVEKRSSGDKRPEYATNLLVCFETADGEIEMRAGCLPAYVKDPQKVEALVRETCAVIARVREARARYYPRFKELFGRAMAAKYIGFYGHTWETGGEASLIPWLLAPAVDCHERMDSENGACSVGLALTESGTPVHSSYYPGTRGVVYWDDSTAVEAWLDSWEEKIVRFEREFETLMASIPADCNKHGMFVFASGDGALLYSTFCGAEKHQHARTKRIAEIFVTTAKERGAVNYADAPEEFLRRCATLGFLPEEQETQCVETRTRTWSESPDGYRPAGSYNAQCSVHYKYTMILGGVLKKEEVESVVIR